MYILKWRRHSTRNVNNSQGREQPILDADDRVGGNINASANTDHVDPQDGIFKQHKTRGFTYMPHVYSISSNNNSQPLKVEFNEYGKPIVPNKSKFVEFLGSIARNGKVVPLNYPDWHKVPKTNEARMMDMIKGSRPHVFTQCYSQDGNTSNSEVASALEKMRDLESQQPPDVRDKSPKDIYSDVLGEDKGGRVRMYGYGLTAKQVYGVHSLGQSDIHRITMEKEALRIQLKVKDKLIKGC
ncbi:hypothetical protein OROHE_006286 [Orobanche hederae]